jgi:septal ring factor EnvC (AmiA/AmiB activator)
MTSPQNLEQRVSRNTNDIDAVYDLLEETKIQVSVIDTTVSTIDTTVSTIDTTVSAIEIVQQRHGERLDTIDGQLGRIEANQQVHGEKLDTLLDLFGNERSGDT